MDQIRKPPNPLIKFFRLVPEGRMPQRADRGAAGTIPVRAFRHCDALVTASAFGWYIFPPISFSLLWDGSDVVWTYRGAEAWYPLKSAQFPGFSDHFDQAAPEQMRGFAPPFLVSLIEPGIIQIWSGLIVRSAPGWSTLVRAPANLVRNPGYECYEGIVATDRWFGPLFTNVRLTRTNAPIEFDEEMPFIQIQPVPEALCGDALDAFATVPDLASWQPEDWEAFGNTVVQPNIDPHRQRGRYGAATRRRRKQSVEK